MVSASAQHPVPIIERAACANCPAPLSKHFGKWAHHWISATCKNPQVVDGSIVVF